MSTLDTTDEKLTRKEAADFLGVSIATLAQDVITKRFKFPYFKIGRRTVYSRRRLEAWQAAHEVNPPAQSDTLREDVTRV